MRDTDAPGGDFIHWRVQGIPATIRALDAGQEPAGASEGRNGFGTSGYRGPCPPHGDPPHHYVIRLTALRGAQPIADGTLVGRYGRS
jgi:Raf kinase inhibitor-like YbhB/YbcL family protein